MQPHVVDHNSRRLEDVPPLQAGISDLASVLALPALWSGRDAAAIVNTLAENLLRVLRVDVVYVRVSAVVDGLPSETVRIADRRHPVEDLPRVVSAIAASLLADVQGPRRIPNPLGDGELSVASCRMGQSDEIGLVVIASARAHFPTEMETWMLQVAANQAALGLQEARRLHDQTREAGRAIAERTRIDVERRRLSGIVEHSPDFIGLATFDGQVQYLNPAGQRIVGIDSDARVRATIMDDYLLPEDRARLHAEIFPALLQDGHWEGELRFGHFQTGAGIPMLHQVFVVDEPDSHRPVIATISRDITQRKREESELLAIKDALAAELVAMTALHEFSTRLIETIDLQPLLKEVLEAVVAVQTADFGLVQLYNPISDTLEIVEHRGFSREQLAQLTAGHAGAGTCARAFERGQRVIAEDVENSAFRAVQATPLFSRTGEPLGVLSTYFRASRRPSQHELRLTDLYARQAAEMIERKRAEDALRRSEAFLVEGQRISQTGSWAWNAVSGELVWSAEQFRLFGLDPETTRPTVSMFYDLLHPEDRAATQESFEAAVRDRADFEQDYRVICPDGEIRHIHSVGHPIFTEARDLVEFIGIVVDVTGRKRAEEGLRAAQAELARMSRVTTIGELTASIAHEVNQPLTAVVANGNACLRWLAGDTPNLDEARQALNRIVRDGMRASGVVARIRALVMKTGTEKERLDLNDAIQEVVAITKGEGRRHGVTLRTELARELPAVFGDRVQLQQVVLNLIVNGIEATPASRDQPVDLVISTRHDGGDYVSVSVRDEGIGIGPDAQNLEQVFDAFYTTKPQGMGIGLSISRSIVEAHDGRLWAERNAGPGTTFMFTLPIDLAS